MSTQENRLAALRAQIDLIDREIVERLNARADLAMQIGAEKKTSGRAVFDPAREKEVTDRVLSVSQGPFPAKTLEFIYREIMGACRSLEEPARIAYLGPEGTFSHAAAVRRFGTSAAFKPQADFADVFREVERGTADFGVIPVENSNDGAVGESLDLFPDSSLTILAEYYLEVSQNLLAKTSELSSIRRVVSKEQALSQCRNWLRTHVPQAAIAAVSSTAEAAREASQVEGVAAVGSLAAAEMYGLQILARSIEDAPNNVTRFFVIGRGKAPAASNPKTSLLLSLKDEPGVLFRILQPLAEKGINMTKIESRPLKSRPWEYRFFMDVEGDAAQEPLAGVLAGMRSACSELRILGTYAKADRPAVTR